VTFAEKMRRLMVWMLFGAGVVCTVLAAGALWIAWRGGWPAGTEHQRLGIVGWALLGALTGMGAVIVSLAVGGPVGRFKATGPAGTSLDVSGDDQRADAAQRVADAAQDQADQVKETG
jgi:hypothetical protein